MNDNVGRFLIVQHLDGSYLTYLIFSHDEFHYGVFSSKSHHRFDWWSNNRKVFYDFPPEGYVLV